jgi:hypothetical protein
MLCSKAMVSGLATEPVGIFLLPKTASREQKPKVANPAPEPLAKGRRYLRPEEANRLIAAAGQRGR